MQFFPAFLRWPIFPAKQTGLATRREVHIQNAFQSFLTRDYEAGARTILIAADVPDLSDAFRKHGQRFFEDPQNVIRILSCTPPEQAVTLESGQSIRPEQVQIKIPAALPTKAMILRGDDAFVMSRDAHSGRGIFYEATRGTTSASYVRHLHDSFEQSWAKAEHFVIR